MGVAHSPSPQFLQAHSQLRLQLPGLLVLVLSLLLLLLRVQACLVLWPFPHQRPFLKGRRILTVSGLQLAW